MILNLIQIDGSPIVRELVDLFKFQPVKDCGKITHYVFRTEWVLLDYYNENLFKTLNKNYNILFIGDCLPVELGDITFIFPEGSPEAVKLACTEENVWEIGTKEVILEIVKLMGVMKNCKQFIAEGSLKHINLLNDKLEYVERRGWGIVKPVMAAPLTAPLCKHVYHGHKKGCQLNCKLRVWYKAIDPNQVVYALYFSMNLDPLWSRLRKKFPHWTEPQVQNNRYWINTKKKLMRKLSSEFLAENPGPWVRALNRGPNKMNFTFGIHYNRTMSQIGIDLKWPPGPYPMTIDFVGRPLHDNLAPEFFL